MMNHPPDNGAGATQAEPELRLRDDFAPSDLQAWRQLVEKDLKGADYGKKLVWRTHEGFSIQPIYTVADRTDSMPREAPPGAAPYRRGTTPPTRGAEPWQVRQDCLLASPEELNGALRDGLARGQNAIGIRLDNAARQGIDGDDPRAAGLAGRGGCTISSINGLRVALAEIDLSRVPITIRTGTSALPVLGMLVALAREQDIDPGLLTGAVEGDPIRELIKNGFMRGSPDLRYAELFAMAHWCRNYAPGIRPVMVNSHPVHAAGASAVQEAAYVLASGAEYMRALMAVGLSANEAALAISVSVSVSTNLFMEIGKLRATRVMWTRMMRALGVTDGFAERMFCHVRTSTWTKTSDDPYNNIIRTSIEGFAAAVGGCDSMYLAPFDETIGRADPFSSRIARNQQLVLQLEAHLGRVADPAGGSYYVEHLTDSIIAESWKLFTSLESNGGLLDSLSAGTFQSEVKAVSDRKHDLIARRRMSIVGVSNYADPQEKPVIRTHIAREEFLAERRKKLSRLKAVRSQSAVHRALVGLTSTIAKPEELMPAVIAAAEQGATLGEITTALMAGDTGTPIRVAELRPRRASLPFEVLRGFSRRWAEEKGTTPKVALLPIGPITMRRARADFCFGFLAAAGFEIVDFGGLTSSEEAIEKATGIDAFLSVLCSDDASYPELVKKIAPALKQRKPESLVYVAGYPADIVDRLREQGADGFIHIKANALEELSSLQNHLASHFD